MGARGRRTAVTYGTEVAANYAEHRGVRTEALEELVRTSEVERRSRVLEVGCGTGNYIIALQKTMGCRCWGVDISEPMLAHARARGDAVTFTPGSAERLDFPDGAFDLVFTVDVIHHLDRPGDYYHEAYRVLAPNRRLCTITDSEDMIRNSAVLTRYFPATIAANLARYPPIDALCADVESAGFRDLSKVEVEHPVEITNIAPYASKANSTLHLIPQEAFERGLARLERDLAKGPIRGKRRYLFVWATR